MTDTAENSGEKNINFPTTGIAGMYILKLYITGMTPNSVRAVRNLKRICEKHFSDNNCDLEIIDVYQNAELAKGAEIIATPTLVKMAPGMVCRLVGDLSDEQKVIRMLSFIEI